MFGVFVTFRYADGLDRARVTGVAEKARPMFEGMPGLLYKFFTFDEKNNVAVNFYAWESESAARAFFTDELRARVTELYGVSPEIEFVEIAATVENTRAAVA
jgi:hypothetical protein